MSNTSVFKTLYQHESFRLIRHSPVLFFIYPAFLFLTSAIYLILLGYPLTPLASPISFFHLVSLVQFFLLPYVSISAYSAERQLHIHWTLFSWPIKTAHSVYAKLLAWSQILVVPTGICLFWVLAGHTWYVYDMGILLCGFLQIFLTAGLTLSLSLYCSTLSKRAWHGIFLTQGILLVWIFGDFIMQKIPFYERMEWVLSAFSYREHDLLLQQGILSTSTLTFFIGLSIFLLQKTWKNLEAMRGQSHARSRFIIPSLWVLTLLFPLQVDLTWRGINRLDPFTKELLSQAQDPIYIHYYYSEKFVQKLQVLAVERQLKLYEANPWVIVQSMPLHDKDPRIKELGLYKEHGGYAGVLIEYRDRAAVIPLLLDTDQVEYLVSSKLHEIFDHRPRLAVRVGTHQPVSDYALLLSTLNRHFEVIQWVKGEPFPDVEGIFVLSAHNLSEQETQDLLDAQRRGVGVMMGYAGVAVSTDSHTRPSRYGPWEGATLLAQEGIVTSNNLVVDPEGFMFSGQGGEGEAIHKIYPLWPKGFGASQVTWRLLLPIFSTPIWPDENWRPVIFSSPAAAIQEGPVNLDPSTLSAKQLPRASGPYILAAKKMVKSPFYVVGSETIFSNMSPTPQNFAVAELLAWELVGLQQISHIKSKKLAHLLMKRPYSPILDTMRFLVQAVTFGLLSLAFLIFMIVRRMWFTKTPFH